MQTFDGVLETFDLGLVVVGHAVDLLRRRLQLLLDLGLVPARHALHVAIMRRVQPVFDRVEHELLLGLERRVYLLQLLYAQNNDAVTCVCDNDAVTCRLQQSSEQKQ